MSATTTRLRAALLIVLGILAALWIIQIINNADHYRLSFDYAIRPRIVADLPYILTAPFLHWSWAHIEGNSVPLVVLGFLTAYRNIPKFIWVSVVVLLTSGLVAWLFDANGSYSAGASGVIFGWFGYVIVRGFFNHHKVDILVGVVVMIYYLPVFTLLLPAPHLGYQDHIGGLIGGVACGWVFRDRATTAAVGTDPVSPNVITTATSAPPTSSSLGRIETELAALKEEILSESRVLDDGSNK